MLPKQIRQSSWPPQPPDSAGATAGREADATRCAPAVEVERHLVLPVARRARSSVVEAGPSSATDPVGLAVELDRDLALAPSTAAQAPPPAYSTSSGSPASPAVQGRSQEPPGKTSALGAITPGAGRVGLPQRRHRLGERVQRVQLAQLGLDRVLGPVVFALAEVDPAQRAAPPPEEEAGQPLQP